MTHFRLESNKMPKPFTHRITHQNVQVPNTDVPMQVAHLYRLEDKMRVATAKDALLSFGEDPQHQNMRVFLDHDGALGLMRKLADRDWAVQNGEDAMKPEFMKIVASGYQASIDEVDLDRRIVPPDEAARRMTLVSRQ